MDQELVQYLDERFGRVEQRLDGHDRRFDSIDQRFEQIDRRFEGVDRRFNEVNERIEEVKRHNGVLVEGLRHELQLVAEGLITHINVRHAEDRAYVDQRFQETNALVRLSLESTDQLRQRVENLERKSPN
jgi:DNA repair exonuclease SbcCD ATPase subunit